MKTGPFGSPSRKELPFINITSLIDVMFLLLIFLLLTTTFNPKLRITLNLPPAKSSEEKQIQYPLRIVIDEEGRIFVARGEIESFSQVSLNELEKVLKDFKSKSNTSQVVLECDGNVPFKTAIAVLDIVKMNGLTSVTIATKNVERESADK